jgi:hypothetical protein
VAIYVPVFRMAVGYVVSYGRRWSVLEHLLLIELADQRHSVAVLATQVSLPERLVIEALINLLRAGWIEVRSTESGVQFGATAAGKLRATEDSLPVELQRRTKWISLCADRLTGAWLRADDLQLVHEKDLPETASPLDPTLNTYDTNDGTVRDLLYLEPDESFESFEPIFRNSSRLYARFELEFDKVKWLPTYAPFRLEDTIKKAAPLVEEGENTQSASVSTPTVGGLPLDTVGSEDIIVGGSENLEFLTSCLSKARSQFVVHSCFIDPATIEKLLPDFEKAAQRKVSIDLLWGLRADPEDPGSLQTRTAIEQVLNKLSASAKPRVRLSPLSSGSHSKILLYDNASTSEWEVVVSSCNYLSSYFDAIEISQRSRSRRLAMQIVGRLIAAQQPASGGWSAVARRLERVWNDLRLRARTKPEAGTHSLSLLVDDDHYTCVTRARDQAESDIVLGCDLFGLAAETSVLVPMTRAVELGKAVRMFYRRPSRFLAQEGMELDVKSLTDRGCSLTKIPTLHGKFLAWDKEALAITSFNWLSTVVDGTRARGAEIGILSLGQNLREILGSKLKASSKDALTI